MVSRKVHFLCGCVLIVFNFTSQAQTVIYQSMTPDGTTQFSDVPSSGSHVVNLSQSTVNNYNASASLTTSSSPNTSSISQNTAHTNSTVSQENKQINYVLNITSPADQTTFQNQLPISVMVTTQPNLQEGDKVQLMIDGKPYGQPQSDLTFSVEGLERGTHQLQARAINGTTHEATSVSSTVTIYKQQASQLLPTQAALTTAPLVKI